MNLTLVRDYAGEDCTLGPLTVNGHTFDTLAPPWKADPRGVCGHPDQSCVPAGEYQLVPHDTPAHPRTWALVNSALGIYHETVPEGCFGRTAVLLHTGNFPRDSLGCILIGRTRRYVGEQWMVTDSRNAFAEFKAILPWTEHVLTISYAPGISP